MKKMILSLSLILAFATHGYAQTRISPINPGWGYSDQGLMNNLLSQPPMGNPMQDVINQQQMQQRAYDQGVADARKKQESDYTLEELVLILEMLKKGR